ncbi:NAD-glutamate dehydrogenase [Solicola gregarius]|uniref:NAD-glutamate dehydrogenase n=1 Tax=Solicola gregarius TaxID=2908642 RepID=A0AA46TEU7_9ACTN|nr:NAD-glutamate dehydrogenase [Solicola gregarius]UYM04059.1 NAD-glutamate dehydrogenase [Solicola gregarius]
MGDDVVSADELTTLVERYYQHVPADELADRSIDARRAAVESQLRLATDRPQGTCRVRAFTPTVEQHGWDAGGHVVVEIVAVDMPFLVDSVTSFLTRSDYGIDLVIHPQFVVRRDITGALTEVEVDTDELEEIDDSDPTRMRESWMHLELDEISDPGAMELIEEGLQRTLRDVAEIVEDWQKMESRARQIVDGFETSRPPIEQAEVAQAAQLLSWLADGHFTFMGYREYDLVQVDGVDGLRPVAGSGLGILRSDTDALGGVKELPEAAAAKARDKTLLIITKANSRSTVHRPVYLDYIGVKTFDKAGAVIGERRFLGLFTSSAYTESVTRVPVLKDKVKGVLKRLGFDTASHSGKALIDLLETYPRDELFQTPLDDLVPIANAVLHLQERRQLRLFLRRDDYGRFLSCLIYLPRDRYMTQVRQRLERILASAVGGEPTVDFTARVTESVLARLHYVVRPERGHEIGELDRVALEQRLADATRSWDDDFRRAIDDVIGDAATTEILHTYGDAFPEAYKEDFGARTAVGDLRRLKSLTTPGEVALEYYAPGGADGGEGRLKIYRCGAPLSLSDVLPLFQALGVDVIDERPYQIHARSTESWIYDFGLRTRGGVTKADLELFQDAFLACWGKDAEADGFNRLVLAAGLTWRQVVILRAYATYLRQANAPFSQTYIEQSLLGNVEIARLLVELFEARFAVDPGKSGTAAVAPDDPDRRTRIEQVEKEIESALDAVVTLDEDRILRGYRNLIRATLRTNFYRTGDDGRARPFVSLKLEPTEIDDLPEPRPKYEIFCYSPRVEGVHLRFGKVARGGLRWSDRREDFRTEVLGLVKAQMVKNTVIVPVGSKGGFYCKDLPDPAADRDAWLAEGKACYTTFISSMLDVTDNRVDGVAVPPPDVVRWDSDDSYLVVAADKGTATFSDLANEISASYDYWLGDAFASGGSVGYDHKGMGITAKGAWESVRRHFREMGIDCQREDFTCVGIGDMSGDVFGNGMLLSEHTRLVAAFDHRHIFVDPNPDSATTYAERRRLYHLPRSSWADYDASLISDGGGVFSRTLKSIPLTAQMRAALGIDDDVTKLSPAQLQSAILRAPVDLLWNGGIGTYVKATSETNDDVGDKANNAIRVNGAQLRSKCVGEGGNLGLTQLGRIEYALNGGRINTDFIDNSAGVDTSDREVNIKILLDGVVRAGGLTREGRNDLLPTMTDEVGDLVLRDNYEQNVALANAAAGAASLLHVHADWIGQLERDGLLDRELEFLPSDEEMANRRSNGKGLTSPELSVLLAYTKIVLADRLIESDIADDAFFRGRLFSYFPTEVKHEYRKAMADHPLRREIIVTAIVNDLINNAGITFYHRLATETGVSVAALARAHAIAAEIYGVDGIQAEIDELDNVIPAEMQTRMRLILRTLTERTSRWMVNHRRQVDAEAAVDYFGTDVQRLLREMPNLLVGRELDIMRERAERLTEAGVPDALANRVASVEPAYAALGNVVTAKSHDVSAADVARVHFQLGDSLGLDRLLRRISSLPRDDRWQTMARAALRDDLYGVHHDLTGRVLRDTPADLSAAERVKAWIEQETGTLDRIEGMLEDIWGEETPDLARLSVGMRVVRSLLG